MSHTSSARRMAAPLILLLALSLLPSLRALGTFAPAADPSDAQWQKMFEVMYGLTKQNKTEQLEGLKSLIGQGADVNMAIGFDRMAREGETRANLQGTAWPLDVAVQQMRMDMVKLLLANGAIFRGKELALAALHGNQQESLAMVTVLLQAGADVNSSHDGFSPLFWASYRGNKDSVKLMLARPGILLDDKTKDDGRTALMAAAEQGHGEIVEMLLKAGAGVSITSRLGETAASLAQRTLVKQQAIVDKQLAIVTRLQATPPK